MLVKNISDLAKEVLDIEAYSILKLKRSINENFNKAIELLYSGKGRVIVTGMGKSGIIGKKIAATLSSTGTPSYFLHPAESTHGDSGIITKDDIVIAISNSGETQELLNLLPIIKRFGIPLIALTGGLNSTLANASDINLDISVEKEACPLNKVPTASAIVTLAMGDAIAVCLLEKRGFTEKDFLMFHPGGALGKGFLYSVSELMIKGDQLPIAFEEDNFSNVIELITQKKLGLAVLVDKNGKMTGVLTDGDIRRTLIKYPNVQNLKAVDVMTANPKTISPHELAAKALHLMEKYSITALAITDENKKPVGILHIHDLLRAGVA